MLFSSINLILGTIGLLFFIGTVIFYRQKRIWEVRYTALDKESAVILRENESINNRFAELEARYQLELKENQKLQTSFASLQTAAEIQEQTLLDKIKYLEQIKEELTLKFKDISQEIIKSQQDSFQNQQKNTLSQVLNPFSEQLKAFKEEVSGARIESLKNKTSFDEQLKVLFDLNHNLSKDAQNLTEALKGGKKIQGNWGECQLERVLEISGLRKEIDYDTQSTYTTEDKKTYRPDVIVHLPEKRDIIIDSKVSLNAYVEAVKAESDEERQTALLKNVANLKAHVDELSVKEYQTLLQDHTLNYVIMFIPVESAYIAALETDTSIYDYAYKKNIILATPLSLLPTLRTIQNLWQISNQNQNVLKIAEHGGKIYDKLSAFLEDMKSLERGLNQAGKAYENAQKKLYGRGGAITHAELIKKLGAKTNKTLNHTLTDDTLLLEDNTEDLTDEEDTDKENTLA